MHTGKFTLKAQEAIQASALTATESGHPEITIEHLAAALLNQSESIVKPILQKVGVDVASLATALASSYR